MFNFDSAAPAGAHFDNLNEVENMAIRTFNLSNNFAPAKSALLLILALVTLALSPVAGASPDDESYEGRRYPTGAISGYGPVVPIRYNTRDRYTDYAEVLNVTPLYREVRVSVPERQCWDENVVYRQPDRPYAGYQSYTPHILGGMAGGVIGNQFGKGTGNTLLTVAGALLGGSIGRDVSYRNRAYRELGNNSYTTTETRCATRTSYRNEEREDGYEVRYRYNERTYTTRMTSDPGDRLRVNVRIVPVD